MNKLFFHVFSSGLLLSACSILIPASAQAAVLDFEDGTFTNWNTSGNTIIETSFYGVTPPEGTYQALLQTGVNSTPVFDPIGTESLEGQGVISGFLFANSSIHDYGLSQGFTYTQGSAIKMQSPIVVTPGQSVTVTFDYNFLTDEKINEANDLAFVSFNEQLIPLASVGSSTFNSLSNTPFDRATEYQTFTYTLNNPGSYTLGFGVLDEFDFATTSGLLLDNIRLEPSSSPKVPESSALWGISAIGLLFLSNRKRASATSSDSSSQ